MTPGVFLSNTLVIMLRVKKVVTIFTIKKKNQVSFVSNKRARKKK